MNKRVVVAMSGGVDSSVAALLLQQQGYDVIGVTMKLYSLDEADLPDYYRGCCTVDDVEDARIVCQRLGVPHYVMNVQKEFQTFVIDYFCAEYQKGRTPHPCIACNDKIKFNFLAHRASVLKADYVATGHYARIEENGAGFSLKKGLDASKDQSYVLYGMGQAELAHSLMPVGAYTKDDIRRMALESNFPNAEKPDSQDICFVPGGDYAAIIEMLRPGAAEPGEIVDLAGTVVGEHAGIIHYTVGQRRGLGIAASKPLYVVAVNAASRRVTVGPKAALLCDRVRLRQRQFIDPEASLQSAGDVIVRLRSTHPGVPGHLTLLDNGKSEIRLAQPEPATARGQAAVCYRGNKVLGGGWIASMERSAALRQATPLSSLVNSQQ